MVADLVHVRNFLTIGAFQKTPTKFILVNGTTDKFEAALNLLANQNLLIESEAKLEDVHKY